MSSTPWSDSISRTTRENSRPITEAIARLCLQSGVSRIRRRSMQVTNRFRKRRHAELLRQVGRQQLHGWFATHVGKCLIRQHAQPALLHALGRRVDRGESICRRGVVLAAKQAVLGMNHLEPGRAAAHLTETADARTLPELRLLLSRKVKEPQCQLTAAIGNPDQQAAAATEYGFGEQDLAGNEATCSGNERADPDELRAILVAGGQQEQQVVYPIEAELLELFRKRRSDALQVGERRIRLQGSRRPLRPRPSAARQRRRRRAPGKAA